MEVKPGYKQSEAGFIPEKWQALPLAQVGGFRKGQGIRKNEAASGKIPCVRYGEIYTHHNDIIRAYNSYISPTVAATSRRLRKGDILFAGSGETKAEIGKAVAFVEDIEAYAGGDIVILSPHAACSEYLGYVLNSPVVTRQKASKGQGDAVVHISASALGAVYAPLPPLTEQRAIAAALSDVDALLGGLDRLIAKKRDLKQAAMQQLLTGQIRLPGFSGAWQVKRLGDVARLYQPETIAQSNFTLEGYPVYGANGFVGWYSRSNHDTPQITVSCRGNCGTVNRTNGPAWITGNAMVINLDGTPNVDHAFMYFALCHADLTVLVSGSGIPQIVRGPLQAFKVRFPPLVEQTAIAAVLSDMDAELSALVARRAKTRDLKQGMMQELLTGRTRLVQLEDRHA